MSKRANLASALHDAGAKPVQGVSVPVEPPAAVATEKEKPPVPPSRAGQRVVTFYVKPEAHKQLRLLGVEEGASVQDLMIDALNDLFRKHGRSIIA
jgi:hypothetical protein